MITGFVDVIGKRVFVGEETKVVGFDPDEPKSEFHTSGTIAPIGFMIHLRILMEPHIQLPWYCFVVIGLGWTKRRKENGIKYLSSFVILYNLRKYLIQAGDQSRSDPRLQNTQSAINSVEPSNLIPQQVQMQKQNPDIVSLNIPGSILWVKLFC